MTANEDLVQRALRDSEQRFRHLADNSPVLMWVSDANKRCTWVNKSWLTFVGRSLEEETGFGWMDNIHPDDQERCAGIFNAAFDARSAFTTEYRIRYHDGSWRWLLDSGAPAYDHHGAFCGFMGSSVDITARKAVETELQERSHMLELLNRVGRDLSAELDLDKLMQSITDAAREVCGAQFGAFFHNARGEAGDHYTLYTLSGAPREAFDRFGLPRATPLFGPTFRGERVVRIDDVRKDPRYGRMAPHHGMPEGHLPVCSYLAVPVISRTGTVLGGLFFGHPGPGMFSAEHERLVSGIASQAAVAIDNANLFRTAQQAIAEHERTGAALRSSEQRFRMMADHAPIMIWMTDARGENSYFSKTWHDFTGQDEHAPIDTAWSSRLHPEERERVVQEFLDMHARQAPYRQEYRLRRHDGTFRWVVDVASPRVAEDGTFEGFIGSMLDITERRTAEEQLRENDRRKDEFLATLAHELRNPLAPLRTGLDLLDQGGEQDAEMEEVRHMMGRQMTQMVRLIDDLLDVSRISRDRLELRKERMDAAQAIHNAVETARPVLAAAGHQLKLVLPPRPVPLQADLTRLSQVFANLLNNAAKYTPAPGRIELTLDVVGDEAEIRVRDNGIGIPPGMQPRIFEMFTQVERTLEKTYGGLGIGLTLAKRLLEMHQGTIAVHSEGEGLGSEFIVKLPLAPASRPDGFTTASGNAPVEAPARILLVDDNRDAVSLLSRLLRNRGHDVRTAQDGVEAIEVAEAFRPEVVLLDIGMPRMNGYDAARALRSRPWSKEVKLIALTGWGQEEDRRRSQEAGFDHHLLKPLDPRTLLALLARPSA